MLVYLGSPFLAVMLLIVYVGALAILFLFVIMLLNIRFSELYAQAFRYLPVGFFVGFVFLLECFYVCVFSLEKGFYGNSFSYLNYNLFSSSNVVSLGLSLFFDNYLLFLIVGFILFVSILGVIILIKK